MNISEFSKKLGCSKDTLRFYDREGLLPAHRADNQYRYYEESDVATAKLILTLRKANLKIEEIRLITDLVNRPESKVCRTSSLALVIKKRRDFHELKRFYTELEEISDDVLKNIEMSAPGEEILASILRIGTAKN
ncbi:hypothetical protein AUQ39_00710 [Lacticaseibacillus casei]|uniref:MerR family transcriptional regulator n=1 Tax=Lacticaseibacillus zeae TaxID=57037 RepID=UPI000249230D|nr:MerR family transcriptional regulator [Lacticaseibacillus zeae]OLS11496.1 hypothetical protein AUQ39_00710 [Lacticaseibacillus casei]QVI33268.1 MerR family transcriptional regulator [Lacticaseibacillus zeae]